MGFILQQMFNCANTSLFQTKYQGGHISNILHCLPNSAWRKLSPECVVGRDFQGFDNEDSVVINDIVSVDKNMGLELNNEDWMMGLQDYKDELSTEELQ